MARLEGHVYRQVNYANGEQPLSGKGAEITGGHFHLEVAPDRHDRQIQ
jgi:RES domain-containing protein